MNKLGILVIAVFFVIGVFSQNALGQAAEPNYVTTDKESYVTGETITISGFIKLQATYYTVDITLLIQDSIGNIVSNEKITPNSDGTFETSIVASGALWQEAGEYTIKANYLSQTTKTTFNFTKGTDSAPTPTEFGQFGTYENLEYSFSIEYPSGWIIDDNLPQENPWTEIVAILPDQDYWSKGIYVNLWKNYFTVTPQEHLERHNENALAWCTARSVENDGFTCSNYLLLSVQPTLIDDREAYLLEEVWTRTENDKSSEVLLHNLQVFDGNDIWTVLAEAVKDELIESDNFLIKIIDSFALLQNTSQEMQETIILSPLKQLKNGILPQEIKCKEDLILTIKISDGSAACVKSETKAKLIERGWASS